MVDAEAVKGIFSRSFIESLKVGNLTNLRDSEKIRIRMVPAMTATGEAVMYAIRVDSVRLDLGGGMTEVDAYVVISNDKISATFGCEMQNVNKSLLKRGV